jgi:hypothetical protein
MPKKFSDFFKLTPNKADDFQKRLYEVIKDATTIVDCYRLIYEYIIGGLKWRSLKYRHDEMDKNLDITGIKQQQMEDARDYFEESQLGQPEERALFEYLEMKPRTKNGPNVFILEVTEEGQKAYRQVLLYLQMKIYNDEFKAKETHHLKNPHTTPKPPNGLITIADVNPDSKVQKPQLNKYVDDLEEWVKENYPDLEAVLAVTDVSELFELVFTSGKLPADKISSAIETMLKKISGLGNDPVKLKGAFRQWVILELEKNPTFWKNEKISAAYTSIEKLNTKNNNPKTYLLFRILFGDFLSPNPHEGESEEQAEQRRTEALNYISAIFSKFNNDDVKEKYNSLMETAREMIQKKYPAPYIKNLLRAKRDIPENDKVPNILAYLLKELADQLLKTLPLSRDVTEVRFFTIQNLDELNALNKTVVYVEKGDETKPFVVVKNDPLEYTDKNNSSPIPRPIYRSIPSTKDDELIAFCNLYGMRKGTFYYRHLENPSVMKVNVSKFFDKELTIDFLNYTIAYEGKSDPTINDNQQAYRSEGSTAFFFADLCEKTKWRKLSGKRRYDPYYQTNPNDAESPFPHLAAYMAAGRGVSRVLPLRDDTLCVWVWNYRGNEDSANYEKLGEALGLPAGRMMFPCHGSLTQLERINAKCLVQIGSELYMFVNYGCQQIQNNNGFYYSIIGLTRFVKGGEEQFYVRVNTPSPGVAAVLNSDTTKKRSRQLTKDPRRILALFDFGYYRRITNTEDDENQKPPFREDFKVIQLFEKDDIKYMRSGRETPVLDWPDKKFVALGVNLPICFNVQENVIQYFKDKGGRGKIINKGNPLFRERKPRKDAGKAMSPILKVLKTPMSTNLAGSKVAATAFANGGMEQSTAVEEDWGVLKTTSGNYLPINQEWCHLRGHGDGGDEYPGNFVSGSFHCNTEQLAIESGQRHVTQQMPQNSFRLHTTAYLLRDAPDYKSEVADQRNSQILNGNYLTDHKAYDQMVGNNNDRRLLEQGTGDNSSSVKKSKTDASPAPAQGAVAPLAAYLRYKVMRCNKVGNQSTGEQKREVETLGKSFDFIFEGQGEFLDKNQFTIITQAVNFALAGEEALKAWYKNAKEDLASSTTKKLQQMGE